MRIKLRLNLIVFSSPLYFILFPFSVNAGEYIGVNTVSGSENYPPVIFSDRDTAFYACRLRKSIKINEGFSVDRREIRDSSGALIKTVRYDCLNTEYDSGSANTAGYVTLSMKKGRKGNSNHQIYTRSHYYRNVRCPSNWTQFDLRGCVSNEQLERERQAKIEAERRRQEELERQRIEAEKQRVEEKKQEVEEPEKDLGDSGSSCKAGNPIKISSGNKIQQEVIYHSISNPYFNLNVFYNSSSGSWLSSYSQQISQIANEQTLLIKKGSDGSKTVMEFLDGVWLRREGDASVQLKSVSSSDWEFTSQNNVTEHFDALGKLTAISKLGVTYIHLQHSEPTNTVIVTNKLNGNTLELFFDNDKRIIKAIIPSGGMYRFAYNSNGLLQFISKPDGTSNAGNNPFFEDNPFREFHYEDPIDNRLLTGITDESGVRFATWVYDNQGRATSSEHANGTEKVSLYYTVGSYDNDGFSMMTDVTNALGKETTYYFKEIFGAPKIVRVAGHQSANCLATSQITQYNEYGFITSQADWEGNRTTYSHNNRGLIVNKTIHYGYSNTYTTTTEWHDEFNLPISITEPLRKTFFTYDSQGQLITKNTIDN